jgi:hypothetical protein
MKRIALAAAIGIGLATSAQAADPIPPDPWIVISLPEFHKADEASPALVAAPRYATAAACWYDKGRVEMYLKDHFPETHYVVWCAQVPGIRSTP